MTQIINLTPHLITLINAHGGTRVIPSDGRVPRVAATRNVVDQVAGVPVVEVTTGAVEGLPDPAPGTVLIVSRMVAEAAPHRRDLVAPDELVRDDAGVVVGCRQLGRVPAPGPAADGGVAVSLPDWAWVDVQNALAEVVAHVEADRETEISQRAGTRYPWGSDAEDGLVDEQVHRLARALDGIKAQASAPSGPPWRSYLPRPEAARQTQ